MKLVNRISKLTSKTFWCTQCNRFSFSVNGFIPTCPIHGQTMVDNPSDYRRVESDAPIEDKSRKPLITRVYDTAEKVQELLQKTSVFDGIKSDRPIPIISNIEDDDLRNEAMISLMVRNVPVSISIPEPRHTWNNRLDPNWVQKFKPALENCEIAVYARRPGSTPNRATRLELEILRSGNKQILIYEPKDKV